jgi:hypothetical protein
MTQITALVAKKFIFAAGILLVSLLGLSFLPFIFENLDAKEIMVIQSPIAGELTVFTEPGIQWQGFGKVTKYPRRDQFSFSNKADQGKSQDESIQTRFNDGGHGNISGTMNWAMPLKPEMVVRLHKDFGSIESIEQQLIRTAMQKVIYNVGPTMSSTESSAERRPDIPKYMDDQLLNGPYLTKTSTQQQKDVLSGVDRTVVVVSIVMDEKGKPVRESHSTLAEYGVQMQPVAINNIKYDEVVEKQIKERQNSTTQVQIAIANALKAEQDAKTIAKQGEATAAKAKWEQETIKAKEVTAAQQKLEVATLAAKEAEQYKREMILRGEGDAQRKQLAMAADGSLEQKLEALVKINAAYATAIEKAAPGAWTPTVQMGSVGNGTTGAQALMEMFAAKTARDLGIDLSVAGKAATAKK